MILFIVSSLEINYKSNLSLFERCLRNDLQIGWQFDGLTDLRVFDGFESGQCHATEDFVDSLTS